MGSEIQLEETFQRPRAQNSPHAWRGMFKLDWP